MKLIPKNPLVFLLFTLFSVLFVACGSDDDDDNNEEPKDTEAPVIELSTPSEENNVYSQGSSILVNATLTDNVELDTCYMSLTYSPKNVSDMLKGIDDEPFQPDNQGYSLSGKQEYIFDDENPFGPIDIDSKPGEYTFSITVEDAAGNEASEDITISIIEQQ
jgi:hypothetical protein